MIFVECKQVNFDMMDKKGAQFLKNLQEKNLKFYFFSLKAKWISIEEWFGSIRV